MTSGTLERLADASVSARGGADLYRFALDDRIPDHAFARNGDGSVTVKGVDVLKAGTFRGLELLDSDLDGMVARFDQLRDAGVFVPPMRLDHSWSVLSVVGHFDALETYDRVDETDGQVRRFLRGDVTLTGSLDYDPGKIVAAVKRGALRNRSSEVGAYTTNGGVELPLVFYGCAFVDIPAVEGLGPVSLSRRPEPHSITNLSATEGNAGMTDDQGTTTPDDATVDTSNGDPVPVEETADAGTAGDTVEAGQVGAAGDPSRAGDPSAGTGTDPDAVPPPSGDGPGTVDGGDVLPDGDTNPNHGVALSAGSTPVNLTGEHGDLIALRRELEANRAELARLRQAETDRQITELRARGVIVAANEDAAVGLLSHDDEGVRRMAGTLLGNTPAPVTLGRGTGGRTALEAGGGGTLIRLGMEPDEVGALWADLTPAERKLRQGEYDAWRLDRA